MTVTPAEVTREAAEAAMPEAAEAMVQAGAETPAAVEGWPSRL